MKPELTFEDGTTVPLTLRHDQQLLVKQSNPKAYKSFNYARRHLADEDEDMEFLSLDVLYFAYLCALNATEGNTEKALGYTEFITRVPADFETVTVLATYMIAPKKTQASVNPS